MDGTSIRAEASTPMTGIVILLTEGPWGTAADASAAVEEVARSNGMRVKDAVNADGMMRIHISGNGMDDMDYLRTADEVFSRLPEYLPQMIPVTEDADGRGR